MSGTSETKQNDATNTANATTGEKRKMESAPSSPAPKSKRKTGEEGGQMTIEESMNGGSEVKNAAEAKSEKEEEKNEPESTNKEEPEQKPEDPTEDNEVENDNTKEGKAEDEEVKGNTESAEKASKEKDEDQDMKDAPDTKPSETAPEDTAVEAGARNGSTPSTILEKGIIYFFYRSRIGIDSPSELTDLQRTYFILRPIPLDAKLTSGPIGDATNARLCAIPKKALPQSGQEKWICFVEKAGISFDTLKSEFLSGDEYETKTVGTRQTQDATPVGEGVYAITSTGRESHLAYILTLPEEIGEVQKEVGIRKKGSMALSTKNPAFPGPANTQFPSQPEFSKEIMDEFRSLRWMGTLPKHLDVVNTQFLLIGESDPEDSALAADKKDEKDDSKDVPLEEMEKLEAEDLERMKALGKDDSDAIFRDLEASAKDHPALKTTF